MHKNVSTFNTLYTKGSRGIIYKRNFGNFCTMPRLVLSRLIEWIAANNFVLDLDQILTVEYI